MIKSSVKYVFNGFLFGAGLSCALILLSVYENEDWKTPSERDMLQLNRPKFESSFFQTTDIRKVTLGEYLSLTATVSNLTEYDWAFAAATAYIHDTEGLLTSCRGSMNGLDAEESKQVVFTCFNLPTSSIPESIEIEIQFSGT